MLICSQEAGSSDIVEGGVTHKREEILIWVSLTQMVMLFPLYCTVSQDRRERADTMGKYLALKIKTW